MKFEFSWQIFENTSNIKLHENRSNGSRVVPRGQTDIRDQTNNRFWQFCERVRIDFSVTEQGVLWLWEGILCNRNVKRQGTRLETVTVQLLLKLACIYPRYEAESLTSTAESCAIRTLSCDTLLEDKLGSDVLDTPCFASCLYLV